jgi:hypothetical protein
MAMVISKCRETGHYAFVATDVSPLLFECSGGPFAASYCPFCDAAHCWFIEDSRMAGRLRDKDVRQAS